MSDGVPGAAFRSEFQAFLESRRRSPRVPLIVVSAKPVVDPIYQSDINPGAQKVMESCPRKETEDFKEKLVEENFYLVTEAGEQGRVPVLVLSMKSATEERKPAVVFLHSSYKCKEWLRPLLEAYVSRGYVSISIDSRYHGERAKSKTTYRDALVSAWRNGDSMPFIFDTVWDLIKLADYLNERLDVDPSRIGITGESLGGMHALFAAAADPRYAVAVPIIGAQGFQWAINHDGWHGRVNSIKPVFEEACADLAKSSIDKEVVRKVWERIAPGLTSHFDMPCALPAIAPRPLLLLNGAEDVRCPVGGLEDAISEIAKVYDEAGCAKNFKFIAEPKVGHVMTEKMVKEASDWFDMFL